MSYGLSKWMDLLNYFYFSLGSPPSFSVTFPARLLSSYFLTFSFHPPVLFFCSICCPSPRSELPPSRPSRLPRLRLRLRRLFPLRAPGETASQLAESFQPTARSEPGGGFLLVSPLQRRSSGTE